MKTFLGSFVAIALFAIAGSHIAEAVVFTSGTHHEGQESTDGEGGMLFDVLNNCSWDSGAPKPDSDGECNGKITCKNSAGKDVNLSATCCKQSDGNCPGAQSCLEAPSPPASGCNGSTGGSGGGGGR